MTRIEEFTNYARQEIKNARTCKEKATLASRAVGRLEWGYSEFIRTDGDSDPGAHPADYAIAIATFTMEAREYLRGQDKQAAA